jgi:ABC-2 type transport system permease protein
MRWFFTVPIEGSLGLIVGSLALYILCNLAVGSLFSVLAKGAHSEGLIRQWGTLLNILSIFLSGYVFPLASLPKFLLPIAWVLPATHIIEIARGAILRDARALDVMPHLVYLALFPVVVGAVSLHRFQRDVRA